SRAGSVGNWPAATGAANSTMTRTNPFLSAIATIIAASGAFCVSAPEIWATAADRRMRHSVAATPTRDVDAIIVDLVLSAFPPVPVDVQARCPRRCLSDIVELCNRPRQVVERGALVFVRRHRGL